MEEQWLPDEEPESPEAPEPTEAAEQPLDIPADPTLPAGGTIEAPPEPSLPRGGTMEAGESMPPPIALDIPSAPEGVTVSDVMPASFPEEARVRPQTVPAASDDVTVAAEAIPTIDGQPAAPEPGRPLKERTAGQSLKERYAERLAMGLSGAPARAAKDDSVSDDRVVSPQQQTVELPEASPDRATTMPPTLESDGGAVQQPPQLDHAEPEWSRRQMDKSHGSRELPSLPRLADTESRVTPATIAAIEQRITNLELRLANRTGFDL